jgi:hypothetical protein
MRATILFIVSITLVAINSWAYVFINGGSESRTFSSWVQAQGTVAKGTPRILTSRYGSWAVIVSTTDADGSNFLITGANNLTNDNLSVVCNGNYGAFYNNLLNNLYYSYFLLIQTDYFNDYINFKQPNVIFKIINKQYIAHNTSFYKIKLFNNTIYQSIHDIYYNDYFQYSLDNVDFTTFHECSGSWRYTDWVPVAIDVSTDMGETIAHTVIAADCTLGGHGYYAYVNAFDNFALIAIPDVKVNRMSDLQSSTATEPSTYIILGLGLVGVACMKRNKMV